MIEKFETEFFIVSANSPLPTLIVKADNKDEAILIALEVWISQGALQEIVKSEITAVSLNAFGRK
jgi:hypothetical protein